MTGDVTGDLTGDSAGTHTGAVVGDVTGSITDTGDSTIAYLNSTTVNVGAGLTVGGNAVVEGNLTVNGTTTTVNSTTMTVDDKNIELGSTASPSDAGANGGGITLKGDTDKTIAWDSTTGAWDLSEDVNVVSGKKFTIADTSVLTATTLGSGVVNSSLTSVGTLGSLGVTGTVTAGAFTGDLTGDVTGDVTGAVTGNVTGNLTGDVTGDVTGDLTGDSAGTHTGAVVGDVTGAVTGNVTGNLTGDVTGDVTGDLTGDVTGNVTGNLTGTVNTASQTNITSVGTLGSLAVTNNITVGGTVDGRDVASDGSKLDGIEASATADQTAAEILTAIKTVDGAGSGLDADTLDGVSSGSFLRSDTADTMTGNLTMTGNITPSANDTYNCGSSANRWANVYSNDLDLSNEGSANEVDGTWGSYLIQEGESDLFIINRRSGKKFRFVVEEV